MAYFVMKNLQLNFENLILKKAEPKPCLPKYGYSCQIRIVCEIFSRNLLILVAPFYVMQKRQPPHINPQATCST